MSLHEHHDADAREQDPLQRIIDDLAACASALRGDAEAATAPTTAAEAREHKVMLVDSWRAIYQRAEDSPT